MDVFNTYPKPIPYFFPMLDVLEYAIRRRAMAPYVARIHVDGIDRTKALQLTNALRARGITLERLRSQRDESEPLIRLADMWAGFIRAARAGQTQERTLLTAARRAPAPAGGTGTAAGGPARAVQDGVRVERGQAW